MDYRTGSHTKYKIEYHFVWVTKYRYRVLQGEVAVRLRELVRQTCSMFEIEIMRRVKGRTSAKLFEEHPHLKKRYWGRHFWARGYFCVTAGELTEKMIEEYLAHHFEERSNANFEIEE